MTLDCEQYSSLAEEKALENGNGKLETGLARPQRVEVPVVHGRRRDRNLQAKLAMARELLSAGISKAAAARLLHLEYNRLRKIPHNAD